jgi:hypothetical protein
LHHRGLLGDFGDAGVDHHVARRFLVWAFGTLHPGKHHAAVFQDFHGLIFDFERVLDRHKGAVLLPFELLLREHFLGLVFGVAFFGLQLGGLAALGARLKA